MAPTTLPMSHADQLGRPLTNDVVAALLTSVIITPPVCLIDSTVISKAATGRPFSTCMGGIISQWIRKPRMLVSAPLRLVFMVYIGTFTLANWTDSLARRKGQVTAKDKFPGLLLTSGVSTALTIYKDSRLARIFGNASQRGKIPIKSLTLFTVRDSITIFASFALPATIAPAFAGVFERQASQMKAAQFLLPVAVQPLTTPIHLLSLDFYNRQGKISVAERSRRVLRDVWTATPARMVRVLPAFGVGGVVNNGLRESLNNARDTT